MMSPLMPISRTPAFRPPAFTRTAPAALRPLFRGTQPQPPQGDLFVRLDGKSAIVTGSTSGIGLAIAKALAAAGSNVMLNGLGDPQQIEQTRRELEAATGVKVLYHPANMRRPAQIKRMVKEASNSFGKVDILVNNAGVQHVKPIEKFPDRQWNKIIDINLNSVFHATKAVLPGMKQNGYGRIINIASAHGKVASPEKSAYVAAKHGVIGLTQVTALETARDGITCNAIAPGYVLTPLVDKQIQDKAKAKSQATGRQVTWQEAAEESFLSKHPNRQFVSAEEIAKTVLFLCSDAAKTMTGATLSVDGGWTAE